MALGWTTDIEPDDPRLTGHETTYQASQGGWLQEEEKPVPGTPRDN